MALASGVRLGVYEVRALIGAGGMGEVYQGRDTRLKRIGRISVVSQCFASADGQRFLMNTILQDGSPTPIRLVLNWTPQRH